MKTIKLKSSLSEDEVLKKVKDITDSLRNQGVITKGDELVAGIDEDGDSIIVTINGDILDKNKYKELAKSFKQIGEVLSNDLKNFDDNEDPMIHDDNEVVKNLMSPTETTEPEVKSETPQSLEEKESKDKVVSDQAVKPAVETYHDTNELLINRNLNNEKMDKLKTLLFSEEELKESKETSEVEEQKSEEVHHDETKPEEKPKEKPEDLKVDTSDEKSEEKHFDEEKELHFRIKCAKSGDVLKEGMIKVDANLSDAESQAKVIEHLGGIKKDTVLEFFDDSDDLDLKTFDDLYFSDDELKNSEVETKTEKVEEKPEEKSAEVETKTEKVEEKPAEVKLHDDLTLEKKSEILKSLAEYLNKAKAGKTLSVAEKYFCDSVTKYFTEEEVKKAVEESEKAESEKPVDEKVEVSKKEFDDMKTELESKNSKIKSLEEALTKLTNNSDQKSESREDIIRRMNKENGGKDLISLAKEKKNKLN